MAKIERQKRIYRKRIPYGMQNFEDVMERDCYYVDKTPFIEKIEESNKIVSTVVLVLKYFSIKIFFDVEFLITKK